MLASCLAAGLLRTFQQNERINISFEGLSLSIKVSCVCHVIWQNELYVYMYVRVCKGRFKSPTKHRPSEALHPLSQKVLLQIPGPYRNGLQGH